MAADTLEIRMAKLEEAYEQVSKRLDDLHGSLQQLRGEVHTDLQQLRMELHTGLRSRVEGWRSAWVGAEVFQPYPSLTMACRPGPLLGQVWFQPPPPQTRRARFEHRAFLLPSHRGLCVLSCWEHFRDRLHVPDLVVIV